MQRRDENGFACGRVRDPTHPNHPTTALLARSCVELIYRDTVGDNLCFIHGLQHGLVHGHYK